LVVVSRGGIGGLGAARGLCGIKYGMYLIKPPTGLPLFLMNKVIILKSYATKNLI
jgi:hypothetical protein